MKKYYVYIHVCPNGKRYVGVTGRDPESRWQEGNGYQYNKHFYSAILKYGWNNIIHEVFEVDSKEEMYRKEVELISFYHSNDPEYGYNNSTGGEYSHLGCKCSEESRKKMSEANKNKWSDPEYREKMSEVNKKKWSDPEIRKKISEAMKGKSHTFSEEHRKRIAENNRRKAKDPEFRKKLSEAKKGKTRKPFSEEARKHMSESHKGKPKPKVRIKLPDGTIIEITKQNLGRYYINKGKKFEYVS